MKFQLTPRQWLIISKVLGFILLILFGTRVGEQIGFFLILALSTLFVLRLRLPKMELTIFIDCFLCIFMLGNWEYANYALLLIIFEALFRKKYLVLLVFVYLFQYLPQMPEFLMLAFVTSLAGYFLGSLEEEKGKELERRFGLKSQLYEMESLAEALTASSVEDARLATVAERARISREIHDNAGHDIIASYMSFQTLRGLIEDEEVLEMYDATLERLSGGVGKIRDILHNIMPSDAPGIHLLQEVCDTYPAEIGFKAYGDTTQVPAFLWNTLAICLKESLTNATRHASPSYIKVDVDVGVRIIRLYVENDGVFDTKTTAGRGISNLRYRIGAVGGNLSTSKEKGIFKLICVVPLDEQES